MADRDGHLNQQTNDTQTTSGTHKSIHIHKHTYKSIQTHTYTPEHARKHTQKHTNTKHMVDNILILCLDGLLCKLHHTRFVVKRAATALLIIATHGKVSSVSFNFP